MATFSANNLRRLRKKRGMTQSELADAIGVSTRSVIDYEKHGVEPGADIIGLMADVLGTSTDYLMGRTVSPLPVMVNADLTEDEINLCCFDCSVD